MKFTPFGIKNQEFNRTVRGYDKDEVHAFLEKLADEFEHLQTDNDKMKVEIERLEEQLRDFKRLEKNLQQAVLNTTESGSKAVDSAKKQTALMIKEAELKSVQIVEKAKEYANSVRDSVLNLREERKLLIARIKALVNTQSSLLEFDVQNIDTHVKKKEVPKEPEVQEDQSEINIDDILEKLL
jgi:cell division initiation protein